MGQSLRTVYLYGRLRQLTGCESIQLYGDSVFELVEGLSVNFHEELKPTPERQRIVCRVKDYKTEDDVRRKLRDDETEIHIYPTMLGAGGGNGGLFKIIAGLVLIAVVAFAVVMTGGALLAPATWGLTSFGSALLTTGIGLVMGGILEATMPQPKIDLNASNDIESSKYLGANGNTVKIGSPIPLILGRTKAWGHIISFNVDAKNVAA